MEIALVNYPKWLCGSASCMAVVVPNPLDLSFHKNVCAVTYGSTRFAIYETIKETIGRSFSTPPIFALAPVAALSRFCGGCLANCIRGAAMTASQLSSYDLFKHLLVNKCKLTDDTIARSVSSVFAPLVATTLCNPIDVIKTQVMVSSQRGLTIFSTARTMTTKEGCRWMWRGWPPSFKRLGPQTVVILALLE
ncbi:mitochondrial carrier domain-containing protein [Fusarium oxysporum]|nr:mitochondrial carrier domain-containing protein [Fusarium oxysporum]